MADSFITVAPDSTGKSMQTYENTISAVDVHAEAVVLVDTSGNPITTLPVSVSGNVTTALTGAANMANGQIAATTTPSTLVAARATRRSVTIRNVNASIPVYVGTPTVTANNGMRLSSGDSISVDFIGVIQVVAGSNSPNVAFIETYD